MSALAKYILCEGGEVFGYDAQLSARTEELARAGVEIYTSAAISETEKAVINSAENIVCTSAIARGNSRFDECFAQGKKIVFRGEFLGEVAKDFSSVVAVAGSHGKTTCTSMCAHVFSAAGKKFAVHAGGDDNTFGNFYKTGEEYFITEACEYKKNLLYLHPDVAVLLNIDRDHMECYRDENELIGTFETFCSSGRTALVCADDEKIKKNFPAYPSFGIENKRADFTAENIGSIGEKYSFDFCENGKNLCRVQLNVAGRCHIYNALAAGGAARLCGISAEYVAAGLNAFSGVKRRFEKIGENHGAQWYCDYAHHPREIAATLKTAAALTAGRLYVIFQPHTYSRTKTLMADFSEALSVADDLFIFKEYAAREPYDESGNAKRLAVNTPGARYGETKEELAKWAGAGGCRDTVLFLGAGDIYGTAKEILAQIRNSRVSKR